MSTYLLPFEVDAEASVWWEEATLHVVEVVVVLEQQGDAVQVPGHNVTPFNTPLWGEGVLDVFLYSTVVLDLKVLSGD
jgi:hypothetical protein